MASRVKPRILAAGLDLFSDFGYYGVTTRALARKADTTEGALYRLFKSKEKLFEIALSSVVDEGLDPTQFILIPFGKGQSPGKRDFSAVLTTVLRTWYNGLSRKAARLMTQAYFVKPALRHIKTEPYAPVDKIIEVLAAAIEQERKRRSSKMNSKVAATAVILTLLHFKITFAESCSGKQEAETLESFVQVWIQGLFQEN